MQQVLEILREAGVERETVLKEKQTITIQKRPMTAQVKQNSTRYVNGTVSRTATVATFKQAERKIQEGKVIGARLFIESAEGYPFGQFPAVSNLLDEDEYCLKSEEGEVLLVIFWATWSKGSLKPMQRIQQMLSVGSEQWKSAVRVVAVSVDEKKEDAIHFIKQQSWSNLHHLTTNGWNKKKDPLLQNFAIEGVPFVVLVDKFGTVDYEGDPNHLSFEGRIAQLLQQQNQQQHAKPDVQTTNYIQNHQQTQRYLRDLISADKINQIFADSELFCARLIIQSLVLKGVTFKQFQLQVYFFEADNNALAKMRQYIEIIPNVEIKMNQVKYVQVPEVQSPHCWHCNSSLSFPYYWLKWQEGTHFGCVDCVDKESTKEGHHFQYEKNSVLLTGKWKRIPIKGLGNNIQPQFIAQFTKVHEFACNHCESGSPLGQARYICLGCRAQPNFNYDYVDFCRSCISKVSELSTQKCFEREMHCANHPWLRVLYQAGSYQRF